MENPEFILNTQFTPDKQRHSADAKPADHFIIDDLLDYPNDDVAAHDPVFDNRSGTSTDSSTVDTCNSSLSAHAAPCPDAQFSSDLCVPYDDLAELEWLSNFVEESFSTEDLQHLQLISGMKARNAQNNHQIQAENNKNIPVFKPDMSVPGKARSKRSRAATCNWTSRLLVLSPSTTTTNATMSSESDSDIASFNGKKTIHKTILKKREMVVDNAGPNNNNNGVDGRRCLHCATDKTPQWRTGPMGPKTLCNACGVRYKSGRLVPEYRPAASPTFVMAKHSNSHRKVLELRRQKDAQRTHQTQQQFILHQNMMYGVSNGDDDLIHHHIGPDYRHLI